MTLVRGKRKIKHDPELYRLARRVMRLPFNKEGSDKRNVPASNFALLHHFARIKPI